MGYGTHFLRLSTDRLSAVSENLQRALRTGDVSASARVLRSVEHAEFEGWNRNAWKLPGMLEFLSYSYGDSETLSFLREDATELEWTAHLARLPIRVREMASCLDVIFLSAIEVRALRAAFDKAEADQYRLYRSDEFAVSPEELPSLFENIADDTVEVWMLESDGGDPHWSRALTGERSKETLPASVAIDRSPQAPDPVDSPMGAKHTAAAAVTGFGIQGVSASIAGVYLMMGALVPLLVYPVLLPRMLEAGDLNATAFTVAILAAIGALPFVLVSRRMGRRGWALLIGAHLLGLALGFFRFALTAKS